MATLGRAWLGSALAVLTIAPLALAVGSSASGAPNAPSVQRAAAPQPKPAAPAETSPALSPADLTFFESRVRPLLAKHCYGCHAQKTVQGGLRLDHAAGVRRGGDSGPVVEPGKPDASRLIQAVRFNDTRLQMPPAGKLSEAEIQILTTWVERGAPYPAPAAPISAVVKKPGMSLEDGKRFWSLRPLLRSNPPAVKQRQWPARRIDAYLLAKLEAAGMQPAPRADRRTLIRRAAFDLTGLPPTPEEIEAFVNDPAPDAYVRLVDRLLASPHYGERWGRHWLDLVRYCDVPESWAQTEAQPWLYRDWVVQALNSDLPYDRFVKQQLAADELPDAQPADYAALGFLGLSPVYWKELKLAPDVIKTVVAEEWEERINTVTGTVLGLTVACARCHDHKFDPVTQKDYYALAGILASTKLAPRLLLPTAEAERVLAARATVKGLEAEAKRLQDAAAKDMAKAAELKQQAMDKSAAAVEMRRATPHFDAPLAYAVESASLEVLPDGPDRTRIDYRAGVAQDVPMHLRGNPASPGQVVPRRFLSVLSAGEPALFKQGSGRRELAEAIFRDAAPLTARVLVNRVWKHHFGRGLVETPSNFGAQGDRPTHPELLDDLAARFIQNGWSLKWLHRELMLSAAYQQSSAYAAPPAQPARTPVRNLKPETRNLKPMDAENRLLGRMPRRRLEVEAWRDAILSASGSLDRKLGGAPLELREPKNARRTLYGVVTRRELDDLLRLYDFPDPIAHSPARFHTTTPLQQLFVLNSDFIGRQAGALLARLRSEARGDAAGQVRRAHALLYGRQPSERELVAAAKFLETNTGAPASDELWKQYLEVLLARNELMFVD